MEARWEAVQKSRTCFRCLGFGHRARTCQAELCSKCGRNHHTLLHQPSWSDSPTGLAVTAAPFPPQHPRPAPTPGSSNTAAPSEGLHAPVGWAATVKSPGPTFAGQNGSDPRFQYDMGSVSQDRHQYVSTGERSGHCYFQIALIEVEGPERLRTARVLLDRGSDSSYIRSSLAEELGLPLAGTGLFSCIGFQEKVEQPRQYDRVRANLKSRFGDQPVELEFWKYDRVCAALPSHAPPSLPSDVSARLDDDFQGGNIDLLIGIDNMYRVVLWEQVDLGGGLRDLDTIFGFVLHGREESGLVTSVHRTNHQFRVEKMWELDVLGISEHEASEPEHHPTCQPPQWNEKEGRYEMGLLWRSDDRPVSNFESTAIRTKRMTDKLGEEKFRLYHEQITDLLDRAVVETCGDEMKGHCNRTRQIPSVHDTDSACVGKEESAFFLPHRGVFGKDKLRIVFDGSARDGTGKSLNEYLQAGRNLLLKLPAVLLNFRAGKIGCQSDIKAAFHQISVTAEDRRFLQFLWLEQRLRFTRVPFGTTCSPHMLLKTIDTHLNKYENSDGVLCAKVRSGIYMDDICTSFSSSQEAESALTRMGKIFREANMHLHKTRTSGDSTPDGKILGVLWSTERDELAAVVADLPSPSTKRELLSVISRTFDPLGMLSPWMIRGKILFQRLWCEASTSRWDDPLPEAIQVEVQKWWENSHTHQLWFPRPLCASEKSETDDAFHVFCDASQQAYCAMVYLVSAGQSRLVTAKSRLAPIKPHLTIPRMELMAALIGARLLRFVPTTLQRSEPVVYLWTDSTDVLGWLGNPRPRKVFVENRVSAILDLTDPGQWGHVRGSENPADLGTRGIPLKSLECQDLWWHGPASVPSRLSVVEDQDGAPNRSLPRGRSRDPTENLAENLRNDCARELQ